jgi:superfamily II DNA or RNA helicase
MAQKSNQNLHTIYMWSTERYKDETQRTKDGKYFPVLAKVGETKEFRAEVRMAQTDSTGVAETPLLLKQWHIPEQYRDKYLHALLAKKGYPKNRDDKDREWIYFTGCKSSENAVEVMDRLINEVLTGKSAITNYPLFDYQTKIVDWAEQQYKSNNKSLLINAIMRAGKCMITHAIAKRLQFKKVLIVTAKPGAIPSWSVLAKGGEEEHVDYCNYMFHDYNDYKKNTIKLGQGDCDIVASSLQFINKHMDGDNSLLKQILKTNWDMVVFDEQHYATQTDNTKKFFAKLKADFKVELSGTPYKTLLSNRIAEENIYNFDYIDEQKIRQSLADFDSVEAEQFKYKAQIDYALIHVPEKIKLMVNDENFNLGAKGIFSIQKGELVYRDAVNEILNLVRLRGYKNLPDKFDHVVEKVTKHSLWVLPKNVAAIKSVSKMLNEHPYFKKYDIIVATGGGNDDGIATTKDIWDVKTRIEAVQTGKSDYVGTITLTCGRFLEGTSIPEWWSVHQINDSKSAEDYFQGSFRCKTPWSAGNKQDVVVFDYNPERFVSVMYQHIERKADTTGRKTEEVADEFTDCSDVYDFSDNEWSVISGSDLQARFLADIKNYTDRVGYLVRADAIDDTIANILSSLKEDSNRKAAKSQFNDNDLTRGSNRKSKARQGMSNDDTDNTVDSEAQLRYALKQIYELINVAWAEGHNISCMEDMINLKDGSLVHDITGLKPKEWKQVLPAVDVIGMNRAIGQYNAL